jgi:hypothetical protein
MNQTRTQDERQTFSPEEKLETYLGKAGLASRDGSTEDGGFNKSGELHGFNCGGSWQ